MASRMWLLILYSVARWMLVALAGIRPGNDDYAIGLRHIVLSLKCF
jgi:hypothetical protein